jgi:hypothetical protein
MNTYVVHIYMTPACSINSNLTMQYMRRQSEYGYYYDINTMQQNRQTANIFTFVSLGCLPLWSRPFARRTRFYPTTPLLFDR